jgi:hypothetical protein
MKPSASRIERRLAKVEARLVPPRRKYLSAIIDDIDDEATVKRKKEKALAEHVARHSEDVGRTVEAAGNSAFGNGGRKPARASGL